MRFSMDARHAMRWLPVTVWLAGLGLLAGCDSLLGRGDINVATLARTWPPYQAPSTAPPLQPEASPTSTRAEGIRGDRRLRGAEPDDMRGPQPVRLVREWELEDIAADSLGRIGAPAVPAMVRMLRDPDPVRRLQAAQILGRIGPAADLAVPRLIEALKDADTRVRKAAARALGQMGPVAESAVGPLLEIIQ